MRAWLSGRASASQAECRGFESRCPLSNSSKPSWTYIQEVFRITLTTLRFHYPLRILGHKIEYYEGTRIYFILINPVVVTLF